MNEAWYGKVSMFLNLNRLAYYSDRFKCHLGSLSYAEELWEKVNAMLLSIDSSIEEAQLVKAAAELLLQCRRILAWSYVWAFWQQDDAKRHMFELLQNEMETKTEKLSGMVEGSPTNPTVSWLWVALRTDDELKRLVAEAVGGGQSQGASHDVQRTNMANLIADLRQVLEAMLRHSRVDDERGQAAAIAEEPVEAAMVQPPGPVPVPKAKAKAKAKVRGKAKARAQAKPKVRPRQRQQA